MKKYIKIISFIVIGMIGVYLLFFFKIPNRYVQIPGPLGDAVQMVSVNKRTEKIEGKIFVTTVRRKQATLANYVDALFSEYSETEKTPTVNEISRQDSRDIQQAFMANSQQTAIAEAYRMAQKENELEVAGLRTMNINRSIRSLNQLRVNDIIVEINGHTVTPADQVSLPTVFRKGRTTLRIKRGNQMITRSFNPVATKEYILNTVLAIRQKNPIIAIDSKGFGGPSAGAMLTLSIYQQLTNQDLIKGRVIAGTGTIESGGTIGQVGGIPQKIVAAHSGNAELFFVPYLGDLEQRGDTNYIEALSTKSSLGLEMRIIPVRNMEDILAYLTS